MLDGDGTRPSVTRNLRREVKCPLSSTPSVTHRSNRGGPLRKATPYCTPLSDLAVSAGFEDDVKISELCVDYASN